MAGFYVQWKKLLMYICELMWFMLCVALKTSTKLLIKPQMKMYTNTLNFKSFNPKQKLQITTLSTQTPFIYSILSSTPTAFHIRLSNHSILCWNCCLKLGFCLLSHTQNEYSYNCINMRSDSGKCLVLSFFPHSLIHIWNGANCRGK